MMPKLTLKKFNEWNIWNKGALAGFYRADPYFEETVEFYMGCFGDMGNCTWAEIVDDAVFDEYIECLIEYFNLFIRREEE